MPRNLLNVSNFESMILYIASFCIINCRWLIYFSFNRKYRFIRIKLIFLWFTLSTNFLSRIIIVWILRTKMVHRKFYDKYIKKYQKFIEKWNFLKILAILQNKIRLVVDTKIYFIQKNFDFSVQQYYVAHFLFLISFFYE